MTQEHKLRIVGKTAGCFQLCPICYGYVVSKSMGGDPRGIGFDYTLNHCYKCNFDFIVNNGLSKPELNEVAIKHYNKGERHEMDY